MLSMLVQIEQFSWRHDIMYVNSSVSTGPNTTHAWQVALPECDFPRPYLRHQGQPYWPDAESNLTLFVLRGPRDTCALSNLNTLTELFRKDTNLFIKQAFEYVLKAIPIQSDLEFLERNKRFADKHFFLEML